MRVTPQAKPKHPGVFVSLFITNRVIERAGKDVTLFDLEGAGYGCWIIDDYSHNLVEIRGDLFVMVCFVDCAPGTYYIRSEIEFDDGTTHALNEQPHTISVRNHSLQFNIALSGAVLPIGFHRIYAYVNDEVRAAANLWVYGPEEVEQ